MFNTHKLKKMIFITTETEINYALYVHACKWQSQCSVKFIAMKHFWLFTTG